MEIPGIALFGAYRDFIERHPQMIAAFGKDIFKLFCKYYREYVKKYHPYLGAFDKRADEYVYFNIVEKGGASERWQRYLNETF